ncbi:MAG: hypothetical protein M1823_004251 [Watsoniomyces obsoletus]|nr:MAG: hypothetical protein M1823_004251 [Watsoniomyces obsoletus]
MVLWSKSELAWLLFYAMHRVSHSKIANLLSTRFSDRRSMDGVQKMLFRMKSEHDLMDERGALDPVKARAFLETFLDEHDLSEPDPDAGLSEFDQAIVNA